MKFSTVFKILEKRWLHIIRAFGRRAFWCDSHPILCVHCKNLRLLIKERKTHNFHLIFTKHGRYLWRSGHALTIPVVVVA